MKRRLGRIPWFLVTAVLIGLQGWVLTLPISDAIRFGLVGLLQVAKLPGTAGRLHDLGRPWDDALWALVPVANAMLFFQCLGGSPSEADRERALAKWEGQLLALVALWRALPLLARTAGVGLPLLVAYAVISGVVGRWVVWQLATLEAMSADAQDSLATGLWAALAFVGLYSLIQLTKTRTASRVSWIPSLFFVPLLIVALVVTFVEQSKLGMGLALMVFLQQAWAIWWLTFGGAATAVGWVRAADEVASGRELSAGDVFAEVGRRTLEVSGPHGARVQGVAIGMQVLVPGILYWLQLAFTDMIAVLHPEKAALGESGKLTYGMRTRLFKVFLATSVVGLGGSAGIAVAMGQPMADAGMSLLGLSDPREPTMQQVICQELWFGLQAWWVTVALLLLYRDRLARQASRAAAALPSAVPG